MSFQEKNIVASLSTFILILGFYVVRIIQMLQSDSFTSSNVFRLWGIIALLAVVGTIVVTIFAHIVGAIVHEIKTNEEADVKDIQDERDQMIELKGTKVAYTFSSIGVALAMLSFVLGQSALVMFALIIFFGVLANIVADLWRLNLYRKGF
jgi:quinol-cytochrome oxidoreductase complex cytochrome b subunit